jgi:hypothetical protein
MAMKALTAVAPRARRPIAPARSPRSYVCDWRELLIRQDAETIWHRLSALVRLTLPEPTAEHDAITQEIFLDLLSGTRINTYLEQEYSSEEIRQEIKTSISNVMKSSNKD